MQQTGPPPSTTPPLHEARLQKSTDNTSNSQGGNALGHARRARAGARHGGASSGAGLGRASGGSGRYANADERLAGRRDGGDEGLVDGDGAELGAAGRC
jgi:hypothetical protein